MLLIHSTSLHDHQLRPATVALLLVLLAVGSAFVMLGMPSGHDQPALSMAASATLLSLAFGLILVDRKQAEAAQERSATGAVGNAAIDALIVIEDGRIVDANRSFLRLSGYDSVDVLLERLREALPGVDAAVTTAEATGRSLGLLITADHSQLEVELRRCPSGRARRHVFAVRRIGEPA